MIKKLVKSAIDNAFESSRLKKIEDCLHNGLPSQMLPALKFLVTAKVDSDTDEVIRIAEQRRQDLADQGEKKIPIWYSPKPGSAGDDVSKDARPEPGKVLEFTMEKIARTGKNKRWGTTLHLIAREFKVKLGVELGACAGISGIYISSVPSVEKFITIEGSDALSQIAKESLQVNKNAQVINALFDDAIDETLIPQNLKIDFAYIDGHHEKTATVHYFNKLLPLLEPGAVVVFDDISWSQDMWEAWQTLSKMTEFSHAIDLGALGVCTMKTKSDPLSAPPTYWAVQSIVGKVPIGKPLGWREE